MINILPQEMRRRTKVDYRLRFIAVTFLALSVSLAVGTTLLVPAFFKAWVARTDLTTQASVADQSLVQPNLASAVEIEKTAASLLAKIKVQGRYLQPSSVLGVFLSRRIDGISIRHIEYQATGYGTARVRLSGIAAKRETLLSFKQALQATPGVSSVELPSDSLTASVSAPFALTVIYVEEDKTR